MTEKSQGATAPGPTHRSVEIGVAVAMILFSLIVIGGSIQVGVGWAFDGPRAGFFPFYIGLMILAASNINLYQAVSAGAQVRLFAEWGQLGQVLRVVIPGGIYVALVSWVGMYLASGLLIGVFMKWIGRYGWSIVVPIAVGVPVVTFIVFEKWFLVPLPKGPIEELLGF
ncbi:MAG: tripartite tricarboxylate transporter TctB family protein [Xanthobacteraceae bacterium]